MTLVLTNYQLTFELIHFEFYTYYPTQSIGSFNCVTEYNIHDLNIYLDQSAESVEYTNCLSAEGQDPTNECPGGMSNTPTASLQLSKTPPTSALHMRKTI